MSKLYHMKTLKFLGLVHSVVIVTHECKSQNLPPFKVIGVRTIGLDPQETQKMQQALGIFEKVMNDTSFQKKLLSLIFQALRIHLIFRQ